MRDLQKVLSQANDIIAVRLYLLDHAIDKSSVGESSINPCPFSGETSILSQIFAHAPSLSGKVTTSNGIVNSGPTSARNALVHLRPLTAASVGETFKCSHATTLVKLYNKLADLSCVGSDQNKELSLEVLVFDIDTAVVSSQCREVKLQILK